MLVALLLLPTTAAAAPGSSCDHAHEAPTLRTLAAARRATLCLVNEARLARGAPVVHTRGPLRRAAKRHATNMMHANFFGHTTPGGQSLLRRILASGYLEGSKSYALGEILAWGSRAKATPAWTVEAWLHSPSHRRALLDAKLEHAGIGVAYGAPRPVADGTAAATYAVEFGMRR